MPGAARCGATGVRLTRGSLFVELDAEARHLGDVHARPILPALHREHIRVVEAEFFSWRGADLHPGEVRYGGGEVHRRRRADWAKRVVRHEIDVVRFGETGDLHRLGQPADVAD